MCLEIVSQINQEEKEALKQILSAQNPKSLMNGRKKVIFVMQVTINA